MSTLTYNKADLIKRLEQRRAEAVKKWGSAKASLIKKLLANTKKEIAELQANLKAFEAGDFSDVGYGYYDLKRECNTHAFDIAIDRLELSADDQIRLTEKALDSLPL